MLYADIKTILDHQQYESLKGRYEDSWIEAKNKNDQTFIDAQKIIHSRSP